MSDEQIVTIFHNDGRKMVVPHSAYTNLWARKNWLLEPLPEVIEPEPAPVVKPFPWRAVERVAIGTLVLGNIAQAVL